MLLTTLPKYCIMHLVVVNRQYDAGWSSPVARRAHNPKVEGSNPSPATIVAIYYTDICLYE